MAGGEEAARRTARVQPARSLRFWLIGAITLAFLAVVVGAVAALEARHRVDQHQEELRSRLRPAQLAGQSLELAYVDQESGHRGYVLTGDDAFLEPYYLGQQDAARQQKALAALIGDDATAMGTLRAVEQAGDRWTMHAEARQALVRADRELSDAQVHTWETRGKELFGRLRGELATLNGEIDRLVQAEVQRLVDSRTASDRLIVADVVGVGTALVVVLILLWGMLTRPLRRLVAALSQVAHHSYENPIPVEGPSELREIASAAETMRESVIAQTSALAVAEQNLTIRAERDRVAADLHDLTIQRVFALGMRLSGLGRATPQGAGGPRRTGRRGRRHHQGAAGDHLRAGSGQPGPHAPGPAHPADGRDRPHPGPRARPGDPRGPGTVLVRPRQRHRGRGP